MNLLAVKVLIHVPAYTNNPDLETFKQNYAKLDNFTQTACFADGTVKGVVGFASPA